MTRRAPPQRKPSQPGRRPRVNPVRLPKHRDLFGLATGVEETDIVVGDWRLASPEDLRRAARTGLSQSGITEDDLAEMAEYEQLALKDGRLDRLIQDGMSHALAEAVAGAVISTRESRELARSFGRQPRRETLRDELETLDEAARVARAQPFIDYMRDRAKWQLEYEYEEGNDGFNNNFDAFISELEHAGEGYGGRNSLAYPALVTAAAEVTDRLEDIPEGAVELEDGTSEDVREKILRDPGIYTMERKRGYGRVEGTVWSQNIGEVHDYGDGADYEQHLHAILHGGTIPGIAGVADGVGADIVYPGMSEDDLKYALKELADNSPYVSFDTYRREQMTVDDFDSSFDMVISDYTDDALIVRIDPTQLDTAIDRAIEEYAFDMEDVAARRGGRHAEVERRAAERRAEASAAERQRAIEAQHAAEILAARHAVEDAEEWPKYQTEETHGPPPVVYEFTGGKDTISGNEGKGFYIAQLRPSARRQHGDLQRESVALGHCIGNDQMGHPEKLRRDETAVYSVRTETGKSKYTIELRKEKDKRAIQALLEDPQHAEAMTAMLQSGLADLETGVWWKIAEVKGQSNRLPGFVPEPGGVYSAVPSNGLTKPIDVRLVVEFLMSLGFTPENIRTGTDIAPGVKAMEEAGVSPFTPLMAGRRGRPTENPRRSAVQREGPYRVTAAVRRLLAKTKPMGRA